jgi:hypothetical protein
VREVAMATMVAPHDRRHHGGSPRPEVRLTG